MNRLTACGVVLALLAVLTVVSGCGRKPGEPGAGAAAPAVRGVTVRPVIGGTLPEELEAVGTVQAKTRAVLAARVAGTVTRVHVREGDRVTNGQLLAELEAAEGLAGAAAAAAAVTEAQQGVEEARSRKALADVTFARYDQLFQEQAVTRQEFDVRRTERDVADQGVARAEARLGQAREQAKAAGAVAGYSRVTTPVAGVVVAKTAEPGQTVFPGMPLATVEADGEYRLAVNVPAALLGKVAVGSDLRVAVDGAAGPARGRVVEVVPTVEPASRTFVVKVAVSGAGLRSGAYGRAWFPVGSRPAMLMPKGALFERGALVAVWVVGQDRTARMRLVKAGRTVGDQVEVLAGLSAGEQVVVAGGEKVSDGARIE
jgi:RND family efflux transporter MFP subunit